MPLRMRLVLLVASLTFAGALVYAQGQAPRPAAKTAVALPALPNPGYPPARPMETTRLAYEFAAQHPEVIKYVPCYCGCERNGHNSNESCFVKSRDAKGAVTYDAHGWGCTICIDVAVEAARMHALGGSPLAIRGAIDRKFGAHSPTSTPTPRPPAAKPPARHDH